MESKRNIDSYIFWGKRYLIALLLYPYYKIRYRKFKFGSYISPKSDIHSPRSLSIGKKVEIWQNSTVWVASDINIEDYVQINPYSFISGNVTIGKWCMVGPGVKIIGGTHNFDDINIPMRFQGGSTQKIIIEENVWIGANAIILGGIKIGAGSIVAAGAMVNKDVPKNTVVGGIPAKIIKSRN